MSARYSTTRQKSCQQCSAAKARCDRRSGCCTRCTRRSLPCDYPEKPTPSNIRLRRKANAETRDGRSSHSSHARAVSDDTLLASNFNLGHADIFISADDASPGQELCAPASRESAAVAVSDARLGPGVGPPTQFETVALAESLEFRNLELTCPINASDISNRWLNTYIPIPGQAAKSYHPAISSFISRILGSYVNAIVRGQRPPPFIHPEQLKAGATSQPLIICFSLAKICEQPQPGTFVVATGILQQEMNKLYEQHHEYDDITLLAAFQAYFLYAMILYFRLHQKSDPYLRQAMMRCQEFACASSQQGLVCQAEEQTVRPKWEAWIVAEAKRRTLYTMYLFDNVLSIRDNLPIFLGTELQGLPAPAGKDLWQATTRSMWQKLYNTHLAEWQSFGLSLDELWPIPSDLGATELVERRGRVDHWLENVDEFGTMLYAVTSCTHGS